jgi:hypothetical protein
VEGFLAALAEEQRLAVARAWAAAAPQQTAGAPVVDVETKAEEEALVEEEEDDDGEEEEEDVEEQWERQRTQPALGVDHGSHTLVVDLGYGNTNFGLAGEANPATLPNLTQDRRGFLIERRPMESMSVEWVEMEALWDRLYDDELQSESADDAFVACTVSPYGPRSYAENLAELLFEAHDAAGVYFGIPAGPLAALCSVLRRARLERDGVEICSAAMPCCHPIRPSHHGGGRPAGGAQPLRRRENQRPVLGLGRVHHLGLSFLSGKHD